MADEPLFGQTTERLWAKIPENVRRIDGEQETLDGLFWPMKRWLASVTDVLSEIEDTFDAIHYQSAESGGEPADTSDLVDPDSLMIQDSWLIWLGQLVGNRLTENLTNLEKRDAIRAAVSGIRGGTKAAIAAAAQSVLTGSRSVTVYDHSNGVTSFGTAGVWDVLLVTRTDETPPVSDLVAAVEKKNAKPAGVVLRHQSFSSTWTQIESGLPTWATWDSRSWTQIEETALT